MADVDPLEKDVEQAESKPMIGEETHSNRYESNEGKRKKSLASRIVDVACIGLNIISTVVLVFLNKWIFKDPQLRNMQISFAMWHFTCTTVVLCIASRSPFKLFVPIRLPFLQMLPLCCFFAGFLILGNLSLAFNSVGFYQLAKIMTTPCVALLQYIFLSKGVSAQTILALASVCAGMQLPALFANPKSPLYDQFRAAAHQPPTLIDLDFNGTEDNTSNTTQINSNLSIMYRQMVSNAKNAQLFFGNPYRAGDEPDPGGGSIEGTPHGPVHLWTGDNTQPNFEDMGNFYSAGRDPIFFSHHSNVDRMWSLWKTLAPKNKDITDSDWLDSGFLFYDENANMVRVKVRDCLDSKNLGYVYQDVEIPWLNSKPTPRRSKVAFSNLAKKLGVANAAGSKAKVVKITDFPLTLSRKISVAVPRPKQKKRSKKEKEDEEEILVIEGIEFDRDVAVKFDVYINDEDDLPSGPDKSEFAGSFVSVPHRHKHTKKINTVLRLGLTDLLEDLDAEDDETVVVTLIPRYAADKVKIGGIKIEFAS